MSHIPAPMVKELGLAPTPGHSETDASPNADPIVSRINEAPTATTVPAQTADQATAEVDGAAGMGCWIGSATRGERVAIVSATTVREG